MQWLVILNYRFLLTMEVYLFRLHKEFIINLKNYFVILISIYFILKAKIEK